MQDSVIPEDRYDADGSIASHSMQDSVIPEDRYDADGSIA